MELMWEYSGLVAIARADLSNPEPMYLPFVFTSPYDDLMDMDEIDMRARIVAETFLMTLANSDPAKRGLYREILAVSLSSITEVVV